MAVEGQFPDRMRRRLAAVMIGGGGLVLLGLFARLIQINVTLREPLVALAEQQRRASAIVPARRGMILDARGRVVAASEQAPDVFVDPTLVDDPERIAAALSAPLNVPRRDILQKLRSRAESRFVVLADEVDAITAEAVRTLRLPGVGLSDRELRKYPLHESMAHVLGWVGRDRKGLEGVELYFDDHLRGRDGSRGTITDARRRALGRSESDLIQPTDGGHVVLTIDAQIQRIAEDAVREAAVAVHAESGLGIVMNPYNGEILAMAGWPSFDPDAAGSVPAATRRNRAVTDPTEPGSTFKPFIMCGALERRYVNTSEKIDCRMGKHYFGGRLVTDTKPRGLLDITGIIAKSSNIGMGLVADRMGNPSLHATIRQFKFGERTGVEFPGEDPGVVYSLPKWGKLTTQSVAMGYEVMVTPLQLLRAFAAIVNDGQLVRPRLVKQLLSASGEVVRRFDGPEPAGRAVSVEVAEYMRNGPLRAVVEEGGGNRAQCEHYTVMGKTGTAKLMADDRRHYEERAYLGTFVGGAPAGHPELVAIVMIRRPDPAVAYYGGAIAAPAVGKILDQSLAYLGVRPDRAPAEKVASKGP